MMNQISTRDMDAKGVTLLNYGLGIELKIDVLVHALLAPWQFIQFRQSADVFYSLFVTFLHAFLFESTEEAIFCKYCFRGIAFH